MEKRYKKEQKERNVNKREKREKRLAIMHKTKKVPYLVSSWLSNIKLNICTVDKNIIATIKMLNNFCYP